MNTTRSVAAANEMLRARGAKVYPDWTQACVDFLYSEVPNEVSNEQRLLDHVWKQYLESDLHEIAVPALAQLPPDINQAHKMTIGSGPGGAVILQVLDVMEMQYSKLSMLSDVEKELEGRKYGGYQRIYLNAEEQNEENGGDGMNGYFPAPTQGMPPAPSQSSAAVRNVEQTHQAKKINFSRGMLKYVLSDGHQEIEGMELKVIPGLSMYTMIGTKLRITNGMLRRGVLEMNPRTVENLGGPTEWVTGDPLLDIRRRLRNALGNPVGPDDEFEQMAQPPNQDQAPPRPSQNPGPPAPQPPPGPPPGPAPNFGNNFPEPSNPNPRPPQPPPQSNFGRPPLPYDDLANNVPDFDDLPPDAFEDGFEELEARRPPRAPQPQQQRQQQHQPPRQPLPQQKPSTQRAGSLPPSQKTPKKEFGELWGAGVEREFSPGRPDPVRSTGYVSQSLKKTPIQQRTYDPGEWYDDGDDLWDTVDPDTLAGLDKVASTPLRTDAGKPVVAAAPQADKNNKGKTAVVPAVTATQAEFVDLDDIDPDLLAAMSAISSQKLFGKGDNTSIAVAGTTRPVVNLIEDDDEPAGSRNNRNGMLVPATSSRVASYQTPTNLSAKVPASIAAGQPQRELHTIGQLYDIIQGRLNPKIWLTAEIVWYSMLRMVSDGTEFELMLILRDATGDLAVKVPDQFVSEWLGFTLPEVAKHGTQKGDKSAQARENMWNNVNTLESRLLGTQVTVKLNLRPTWSAVNVMTQDELGSVDYQYLPVVLDCEFG